MTPEIALSQGLNRTRRRIRVVLVSRYALRGLWATCAVCLLWVAAARVRRTDEPSLAALGGLIAGGALAGAFAGAARRLTAMAVARATDRRAGGRDRLATALELQETPGATPLRDPQILDASRLAARIEPAHLYPMRVARDLWALAAIAVLLLGLWFAPSMPIFWSKQRIREAAEVRSNAVKIERIAREEEKKASEQKLSESAKAAIAARKLAQEMKKGRMTKKEALVKMSRVTKAMEAQHSRLAAANAAKAGKPLAAAAEELRRALEARHKEQASREADMPRNKASKPGAKEKDGKADTDAMRKAQEALAKFAEALASDSPSAQNSALQQLADQMKQGGLSQAEMKQLGEQLKKLADSLKGTKLDKLSKQFAELAKAMQQMHLSAEDIKRIIAAMRGAGAECANCTGGNMRLDAESLAALIAAMKQAKLNLGYGKGAGMGLEKPVPRKGNKGAGFAYIPNRPTDRRMNVAAKTPNAKVTGKRAKTSAPIATITTFGDPDPGATSATPLYQAPVTARRSAESSVGKESIPPPYRKQVKDYFEAIRP